MVVTSATGKMGLSSVDERSHVKREKIKRFGHAGLRHIDGHVE